MATFQQPGISNPEDKFVPAESKGALLLFFPTQLQTGIKTAHGESDAVAATVVRLNDGRVFENALIFPTALVTQLKAAVPDGMVLGTLGQGENTKGNPPWLLSPHTEADVQVAERWLAANPRNQFSQPQAQAAPPTAPAWGAPATAPAAPAWGQQPPAAAPAAPATGGWGNPPSPTPVNAAPGQDLWGGVNAAPAAAAPVSSPGVGWGAPAAAAPPVAPAPAPTVTSSVHPGLVEALRKKGIVVPPDATQEAAEGIWAVKQHDPDVVA